MSRQRAELLAPGAIAATGSGDRHRLKTAVLFSLGLYKRYISPALPHSCRYQPTCSEYAMEAVERHGVLRGAWMAALRLLRCNPFGGSGYDPVRLENRCSGTQHVGTQHIEAHCSQR